MTVGFDTEGPVAVVTIDRPEVRNAVDGPTANALHAAFERFDGDDSLAVAVLTGSGGMFCAGADLKALGEGRGNRVDPEMSAHGPMGPTRMTLSKPVVAAVEGFAVAGGLELAIWCDMRVAASDATFGVYCRRWGVPLVDGGTVRLPRLVGHGRAMDMILTGRAVPAEEALQIGLCDRLSTPGAALQDAVALAGAIAAFPQACMRSDRTSAIGQWDLDTEGALAMETRLGLATIRSGETAEGAARFVSGAGRHGSGIPRA